MPRKPKCQICGIEIDKEVDQWVKNSTGYFHKKCKDERDDLRAHRYVSCIVCGKKLDRKQDDYVQLLGGFAHAECDVSGIAAQAAKGTVKTLKCVHCGKPIIKSEVVKRRDKNFHADCVEEYEDKIALFDYCCSLWGLKAVGPVIARQAKMFREQGYTYKGMMFSLKYFYEVRHNDKDKFKGRETIGIIPHIYDEAKYFYSALTEQRKEIAEQIIEQRQQEIEVRRIKPVTKKKAPVYEF